LNSSYFGKFISGLRVHLEGICVKFAYEDHRVKVKVIGAKKRVCATRNATWVFGYDESNGHHHCHVNTPVYHRAQPDRCKPWSTSSRVCRRLPNPPQHIRRGRFTCSQQVNYVTDVNAWLSVNWLRLNASKTQLMWLGSTQLLNRITYTDISVLGTHVVVSESSRDLILELSSAASCRWRRTSLPSVESPTTNSANFDL